LSDVCKGDDDWVCQGIFPTQRQTFAPAGDEVKVLSKTSNSKGTV
jgi:hypothetical protein